MPDVSVVVVSFRSAELAVQALESAARSAGALTVQEIVVDNASGDAALVRAARPGAEVVELPVNRGFAAGTNAGLERARGRFVLLLNPDAFAIGDAVARLVAYAEAHPRAGVVAPALVNPDGSPQPNAYRRFPTVLTTFVEYCLPLQLALLRTSLHPHNAPAPRTGRIAHATGAALLARREAVQPLDEGFFLYFEETEWQRRLTAAGWEVHLVADACVEHLGGQSTGGLAFASPQYLQSMARWFGPSRHWRAAVAAAAALSLPVVALGARLRPGDPRFAAHAAAYRRVLRLLRAS